MSDLMTTQWLDATTTVHNWALVCLLAAAALAVAFLGWQTWQCRRRHIDINLVNDLAGDQFVAWDETGPPPAATPDEPGRDTQRAASRP